MKYKLKKGYIAITSAVMITVLVITIALTLSLSSFLGRASISSAHYKQKSRALSEACVETARLKLASDSTYSGNETTTISGSDTCHIFLITASGTWRTITSQASYQNAVTDLKVIVNVSGTTLVSWEELNHF